MAGSEWYYAQDNRQLGPVTIEALIDMIGRGHVQPTDLVWTEDMPDWRPASTVPALMPAAASVMGGGAIAASASLNYFSPTGAAGNLIYAGFWMRFAAQIIDIIILWVGAAILRVLTAGVGVMSFTPGPRVPTPGLFVNLFGLQCGQIVMCWLYFALMESSQLQATVGKLALGIIVTDMQGQRVGFGQATGRYFGRFLSYFTLCIGFMMAGWTQQKQALHDIMAGCLVIRKP